MDLLGIVDEISRLGNAARRLAPIRGISTGTIFDGSG
jgi:hypothetical protein